MTKRAYSIAFKKEVIEFMQHGNTAWATAKHLGDCDKTFYDPSMLRQWYKKGDEILLNSVVKKRISGADQKPELGDLEETLSDEIHKL